MRHHMWSLHATKQNKNATTGNKKMITKEYMKAYVESNEHLISVKKQAPGITVLKYKNKVFYKNLWTPETMRIAWYCS